MKFYWIFFLFIPMLFSCDTSKKATESGNNQSSSNVNQATSYRFIISFISKGTGIDRNAMSNMNEYLKEYEAKNGVKISLEKYPWGKEGEVDVCFTLTELNKEKQKSFIDGLKNKIGLSDSVHYQENTACKHKK